MGEDRVVKTTQEGIYGFTEKAYDSASKYSQPDNPIAPAVGVGLYLPCGIGRRRFTPP